MLPVFQGLPSVGAGVVGRDCPFQERCWPASPDHIFHLNGKAMAEDRVVVEPTLGNELEPFTGRLGFLDFETVSRAIPVWPGMAPWQQAAAQFSYHELQADGTYTHAKHLAEGPEDARRGSSG